MFRIKNFYDTKFIQLNYTKKITKLLITYVFNISGIEVLKNASKFNKTKFFEKLAWKFCYLKSFMYTRVYACFLYSPYLFEYNSISLYFLMM